MESISISVIIPVYNVEKYLCDCIESVLLQTYRNFEIILINDGSTDTSGIICDEYKLKDNRIKVIHQDNAGVSVARNNGLKIAKNDYVIFMDSDDYIESNMYETMVSKITEYSCDLVICDCVKEFGNHSELYTHGIRSGYFDYNQLLYEYYPQLLITDTIEYPLTISNCLCLFRKSVLNNEVFYQQGIRYSEDWLFGAQLMLRCNSLYYLKGKAFYHYRMNEDSATHILVDDKWNDYCKLYDKMEIEFLNSPKYNFKNQLDVVLLFLVYNAISNLCSNSQLTFKQKKHLILDILDNQKVKKMFKNIQIGKLKISKRLKIITLIYKYRFGIIALIAYLNRR